MARRQLPAPRWRTPLPPGITDSWGPDVAAYATDVLGITLDRWQRVALNRALAVGPDGRLAHRVYLISTARQNGKTALVRALIGWSLTAAWSPPWSSIAGLAFDRKQAAIPYRAVLADLAPVQRRVGHIGRGGLALTRYLGIRSAMHGRPREYHTYSREARDALRGESIDLAVFDEVRTQRNYETWAALEPTTTARPDPLIIAISTAGDDRSILLRDWWDRGRRIIDGAEPADGFGMTWYAAGDDLDPMDPKAWRQANPSLAEGRIAERAVREGIRNASGPAMVRSERLNLWTDSSDEWLPPGLWTRQVGPQPGTGERITLAVEAVPSWRRATVTVAIATDAGVWAGVAGELNADLAGAPTVEPAALQAMVERLIREWQPASLAFSSAAAAAPYAAAAAAATYTPPLALGPRQLRAASQLLRSELIGGRLTHGPDPLLAQQVRVARPSAALEGGDWYVSIRDSLGDVDAIRALAWAAWAAIAPEAQEDTGIHL